MANIYLLRYGFFGVFCTAGHKIPAKKYNIPEISKSTIEKIPSPA